MMFLRTLLARAPLAVCLLASVIGCAAPDQERSWPTSPDEVRQGGIRTDVEPEMDEDEP